MVASLPVGLPRRSVLVVEVALASEASGLLARRGQSTELTVLVLAGADPVDVWVASDGVVSGVNDDHLVELVGGVLADPVRVQDSHLWEFLANSLLGDGPDRPLELQLVDTLVLRLAIDLAYSAVIYVVGYP